MTAVDIGRLDQQIRIEQRSTTQESVYGTLADTWTTFATVWAQVQDVLPSKAESQAEGIRIAERPARVRIRYLDGLSSDMRIVLIDRGNRLMKIATPPAELGRQQGMEFMAVEFSTAGAGA